MTTLSRRTDSLRKVPDDDLDVWRDKATQALLLVFVAVGLPLVVLVITGAVVVLPLFVRIVAGAVWGVLLFTLVFRRVHYRCRVIILLAALYVLTAAQLAAGGLAGQGRVSLILVPVLAIILLGLRAGWLAFSGGALLMATAAVLAVTGVLEKWGTAIERGDTLREWAFQSINLLAALFLVMVLLTAFVRLQRKTTWTEREVRLRLEQEIATRRQCEIEIDRVGEEERRRLGSELHDGLCQELTAALLQCTTVENRLAAQCFPEAGQISQLRSMIEAAIGTSYDVSKGLCPVDLDPEGLVCALERLAEQTQEMAGIECRVRSERSIIVRSQEEALHLFRIAQEAVRNAVRHARCRSILIELQASPASLTLCVRDDGAGCEPQVSDPLGGMGIRLMAYRAEAMGGTLTVGQPADGGTVVTCRLPVENKEDSAV